MKKIMMTLVAILTMSVSTHAMSYEQARNEALFLTDKMAYELNLTDEQYEAAYEINLDYLMGVNSYDDVYGPYWERRNLDMSYILLEAQWNAFINATYFYRPLYWDAGYWHFGIYARYPHRDYFYFGRPHFYATYRGAHAWHRIGGRGYYYGRRDHFRPGRGHHHFGMRDGWNRGDYRHGRYHGSTHVHDGRHHGTGIGNGGRHHGTGIGNGGRHHGTGIGNGGSYGNGGGRHHGTGIGNGGRHGNGIGNGSGRHHGTGIGNGGGGRHGNGSGTIGTTPAAPRNNGSFGSGRIGSGSHGTGTRLGSGSVGSGSHGTGSFGGGRHGGGSHGGGSHGGHGGGGHFGGRR